jgi:hypothetical protein
MLQMREISFEYRFSASLALVALVLSLATGVMAGNSMAQAMLKSVILGFVFLGIGYIAMFVLKRYVPEIYESLNAPSGRADDLRGVPDAVSVDGAAGDEAEGPADVKKPEKLDEAELTSGFAPFKEDSFDKYSTKPEKGGLGKHLFEEKKIKYEPKIMAEAIRTMMSRDRE